MMRNRHLGLSIMALAMITCAASCASPELKYIGYRFQPDHTRTTGKIEIETQGIDEPAEVWLDGYAVPHIRAKSESSLYFAIGYMQARDRRFQMEMLKFLAAGRMRELIGDHDESGVLTRLEIFSRMIGFYLDAQAMIASLPDSDKMLLSSYTAGVNAATAREPVPLEFRLLGCEPEPWTVEDTGMIMAMISFGLNKNWEQELGRLELIVHQLRTGSSIDRALEIWKPRYNLPPHLVGERPEVDPFADIPVIAPELAAYLIEHFQGNEPLQDEKEGEAELVDEGAYLFPSFLKGASASNNWAMTGEWTGTGKGALSSDPHLPHAIPPLGYLSHVACDGCEGGSYNVIGGGFVGMPATVFGTNGTVAWGATSNWADAIDLYVEKADDEDPGSYITPDGPKPFMVREEIFKIRQADGTFREEKGVVRSTDSGIMVSDFIDRLPGDFPLVTMKRYFDKSLPIGVIRELYRSGNVTEARISLHRFTALIAHWVMADDKGNVGYIGTVNLPKREHHLGTVPSPAWVATYSWNGFFSPGEVPWIENPAWGFVGSANNQVVQPESFGYPINCEGDIPHRYQRIDQVLSAGSDGRRPVEQILSLQRDNVDMGWIQLLPVYSPVLEGLRKDASGLVSKAANALLAWDGTCEPDASGPAIFQVLNAVLVKKTLEDEVSEDTMKFIMSYFNIEPLVYSILEDPDNPAWDDRRTDRHEEAADVIREGFREAVDLLTGAYGPELRWWKWSEASPFTLRHPFGGSKLLGRYLNRGPIPTAGASNTVFKNQSTRTRMTLFPVDHGPVMRICVDLSDIEGSRMSIPGGQSGRPASPHYDDMLEMYLDGEGASMDMDFERIAREAICRIIFVPTAQ